MLRRGLAKVGHIYRTVTDRELVIQPRLRNVQLLLQFGRQQYAVTDREAVRRFLDSNSSVSWGDVGSGTLGSSGRELSCRLVLEGHLAMNLTQPLLGSAQFFATERSL